MQLRFNSFTAPKEEKTFLVRPGASFFESNQFDYTRVGTDGVAYVGVSLLDYDGEDFSELDGIWSLDGLDYQAVQFNYTPDSDYPVILLKREFGVL